MDKIKRLEDRLRPYLPAGSVAYVIQLLIEHPVHLYISRPRSTKLGDYRPPRKTAYHRISVNSDLNSYNFLITLLHEIAHLHTFIAHKNRVQPHGREWKSAFREVLKPVISRGILPDEIEDAVLASLDNPKASSCADKELTRALRQFDEPSDEVLLEEVENDALFVWNNKRVFRKGEKLRSRYRCIDQHNKRVYLINGLAPVKILEEIP